MAISTLEKLCYLADMRIIDMHGKAIVTDDAINRLVERFEEMGIPAQQRAALQVELESIWQRETQPVAYLLIDKSTTLPSDRPKYQPHGAVSATTFLRQTYPDYLGRIYATELQKVDWRLLKALRNECGSPDDLKGYVKTESDRARERVSSLEVLSAGERDELQRECRNIANLLDGFIFSGR